MSALVEAMAEYETVGSPAVCPRCGAWGGPWLPLCTDDGWTHATACERINYADDVCGACDEALKLEATP